MKTFVLILLAVFSFISCNGQAGGLGFWNPPQHQGGDTINVMYEGFFLARQEGAEHYVYMLPKNKHALVKYRVFPSNGPGIVLYGDLDTPGDLINPTEIKEAGGHLFILDRGGTRITRINISNPNNVSAVFDNPSTPYPFYSFEPLLQPGDPIGDTRLFGLYFNEDELRYWQDGDTLRTSIGSESRRMDNLMLLSEAVSGTKVVLRTGIPWVSGRDSGFGYAVVIAGLASTQWEGFRRLVTVTTLYQSLTKQYSAWILNSSDYKYGYSWGWTGSPLVSVVQQEYIGPLSFTDVLLRTPAVNVGSNIGVLVTTLFEGYGQFTSLKLMDGATIVGPNFVASYWSPVLNSSSTSIYVISTSAAPGQKIMYRLNNNGTWQLVRGLVN